MRRTTVTIAARLVQKAGMTRYCRGRIQNIDRPALDGIACEGYALLKHNIDKIFPVPIFHKKTPEIMASA